MSNRPRIDALFERCKNKSNIECTAELEGLCRTIEGELTEAKKQRDALAEALESLCTAIISGHPREITGLLKQSGLALAATKGGSHVTLHG